MLGAPAVREKLGHQKIGQTSIRLDSLSLSLEQNLRRKSTHADVVVHTYYSILVAAA